MENTSDADVLGMFNLLPEKSQRKYKLQTISRCAADDNGEAIAEAFADKYANGNSVSPLSKAIVEKMKEALL